MRLDVLVPASRNPKGHADTIRTMIERFGYTTPIELDERTGRMVAGHGRLEKLVELKRDNAIEVPKGIVVDVDGEWKVPVLRGWASVDDDEAEAYLVGHNRSGEGGWLRDPLHELLTDLASREQLHATGFDQSYIDDLALMAAPPVDLDALGARVGKPNDEDYWPVIRVQVSPELYARWRDLTSKLEGTTDAEKIAAVCDVLEA